MGTVNFMTENAVIELSRADVMEHLEALIEQRSDESLTELMELIALSGDKTILIPEEHNFIALDLIATEKGVITCNVCGKSYRANELDSITVGHGKSPFELNLKKRGGVKSLFKGKQKLPALFGGKGYRCPENHELISLITWQT
jgi:hypothetical protein